MNTIFIILLFMCLIVSCITYKNYKLNEELKKENKSLEISNKKLYNEKMNYNFSINQNKAELNILNNQIASVKQHVMDMQSVSDSARDEYAKYLETTYQTIEDEYDALLKSLYNTYDKEQENVLSEIAEIRNSLDNLRATRAAAIQAQLKEKEIKEQLSFYCLQPTANELDDVKALERVKPSLHQPRILCMLIWSTYFQKPMTALCNNVLGTAIVTGIYKITNQETNECYIGQAVDVAKRWKDHAKCGLGIDTPASNKLYKAIQEYGIWNFSWELLEQCSKEELNEKESFYINLYDSCTYGYNSNTGVKKS